MMNLTMRKLLAKRYARRDEGAALITAMIVLVAMTMLGFSLLTLSQVEFNIARNQALAEEALFAAEQGVLTGVRIAEANRLSFPDPTATCPGICATSDVWTGAWYPRWEVEVVEQGLAPQEKGGQSIELGVQKMVDIQYRVRSEGSSRPHTTRRVECLVRFKKKGSDYQYHAGAGEGGVGATKGVRGWL
jgi:hypothetical protein